MFNYDRKIVPKNLNPILTPELKNEVNFFLKTFFINSSLIDLEIEKI